ncbi:ThuA domain-containing protein [Rubripirellula reticaptiva]|uniref:Trehalose utilization n=1 Tax=Rubripirellula reticaptiva TaxID=2528013 RepID=A0A5C6EUA7_9BACT|nr:ThuA domain-containing protein [Rubripirellula reticaptiva]TWU51974.1 Trehalose utilization [Rubripirellula reticaptiva]
MIRPAAIALVFIFTAAVVTAQDKPKQKPTWEQRKAKFDVSQNAKDAIIAAIPIEATVKPTKPRKALVFYRCEGFVHGSIPSANYAVEQMGAKTDAYSADIADSYDVFTTENLKQYDCIILNNTTGMQFPKPSQLNAFLDFIADGKGLAGIHAASDNFGRHPECVELVGGRFAGHPWGAGGTWAFKLDDPKHILNATFKGQGFWHQDEIYQYRPDSYQGPSVLRLLVSLDMSKDEVSGRINDGPREVPVSWIHKAGKGRVFYTNFGHRDETFENPDILRHILDGIQYAIGDLNADDTATSDASIQQPALAPEK